MALPMEVFEWKHARVKDYLDSKDLGALIVTSPANFYMLTGFHLDVAPWERPVAAVFPAAEAPFMVMNSLSSNHLKMSLDRNRLYVKEWVTYFEHHAYRGRTYTTPQWTQLLAEKLSDTGVSRGRIGVEGADSLAKLRDSLPGLELHEASEFFVELREVKHPGELEVMRAAAALTDWGQDRYMDGVAPGKLCAALDAEIAALMYDEGARRFPDSQLEVRTLGLSGPASASPHGNGANLSVRFAKGHGVVNIIIVRLDGLVVENERTLFLGEPSDLQNRAYEAATQASIAASEQMVAGNRVAEIEAAAQQVIENAGFGQNIFHRTGHGMGIEGHEYPADVAFNYRLLKENEVWSCEPGIYIYGVGGFRQDNTVIVGRDSPEVITKRSTDLKDQTVAVT